jgi:hypothetical protein
MARRHGVHVEIGGVYAIAGAALALAGALLALTRARRPPSFYAAGVYHMTRRSHRRFAALSSVALLGFFVALRWPFIVLPLLAIYTLAFVLYASSFARGFSGEDE